MAQVCLDHGEVDRDLAPLIARQRATIAQRRDDLDRLDDELVDLEATIAAVRQTRGRRRRDQPSWSPIRVLFVCTGNSARSQIAEALLARLGGSDFEVVSAGTMPKGVNPYAVRVLATAGIDWSEARSKSVGDLLGEHFDYVITVCDRARQSCPIFPGAHETLHWGLEDPAEVSGTDAEKLAAFEATYKELQHRIRPFIGAAVRAAGQRRSAPAVD